jgi:hypothetical protein
MKGITEEALEKLNKASLLTKQAEAIMEQSYELSEDYTKQVMKIIDDADEMTLDEINEYLFKMPSGFYRAELRGYYNKKFKKVDWNG